MRRRYQKRVFVCLREKREREMQNVKIDTFYGKPLQVFWAVFVRFVSK